MTIYWILLLLPAAWRFLARLYPQFEALGAILISIVLIGVIGLRDQVGCDWFHYLDNFNEMSRTPFSAAVSYFEPGHIVVNQVADSLGFTVHATNFVYAIIFVAGWMMFVTRQPVPWLALLLSVPYLITVVAMGYTRQSTAIGLLCLAFNACIDRRIVAMVFWIVFAALFHKSALLFLGLLPVVRGLRLDLVNLAMVPWVFVGFYFMRGDVDQYVAGYVTSGMTSDGGPARLILTALSGALFLWFRRFFREKHDYLLFAMFAILAISSLPLSLIASTATDRLALYLLPFQIALFARLPLIFSSMRVREAATFGVIALYAVQQFVWLNYATNASCWLPYKNVIL